MKLKKFLCVLLCVLCVVMSFSCKKSTDMPADSLQQSQGGVNADDEKTVKVVIAGSVGDRMFFDDINESVLKTTQDTGVYVEMLACESEADYEEQLVKAAESGTMVAVVGNAMTDILKEVAGAYPDVKFIYFDGEIKGVDNIMSVKFAQNEGAFLVGYIAAKKSKTGVLGVVSGDNGAYVASCIGGFSEGAMYANKDIVINSVPAGTFTDTALVKNCAKVLIDDGADVLFHVTGKAGKGVFEAANENDVYAVGMDADQKYFDENTVICSMVKDMGKAVSDILEACLKDESEFRGGEAIELGLADGYMYVGYGDDDAKQQVSKKIKKSVEELAERIISGEIKLK